MNLASTPPPAARRPDATLWVLMLAWALLPLACAKARYPNCRADGDCTAHQEVCVQGSCQQCRTDAHCAKLYPDEARSCQQGRCSAAGDCQSDADCTQAGLSGPCREGRCADACKSASDCPSGQACQAGRCQLGCLNDSGCGPAHHCIEGRCRADADAPAPNVAAPSGACVPPPEQAGAVVNLPPVHFAFNTSELPAQVQADLQQVAACIGQAPANLSVVVEGHCDDRGTQEYNLALGQRRAQSVVDYLTRLGVAADRLEARSKGENEPTCTQTEEACYAANRRAAFVQTLRPSF